MITKIRLVLNIYIYVLEIITVKVLCCGSSCNCFQEALCDTNEELQESAREIELQLREDVDMANARALEAQRRLDAVKESISDYEDTINKFREHVTRQQVYYFLVQLPKTSLSILVSLLIYLVTLRHTL